MGADEFFSPTPFIVLSAAEFDFAAWIDGNQPSPQVLLISNVGPNDMPWDITQDCSWLSVEPNSGLCPAGGASQVTLRVDANGLPGGNHTCTLNITAPNASNSPLTVLANLRVYGPVISLSSSDIDFLAATDNPHPPDQMLYIANNGISTLNWEISLSGDCSWLTVYPTTGQSTGDVNAVTLHADAAGLEAGFYACDLIVSDFYADNNPQIVPVGLYVCPQQGLLIVPTVFGTIQEAVDAAIDGDQIVIVPGTYSGPGNFDIDFGGKEITVRSIAPNDPNTVRNTIVDGNSGGPNQGECGFGFVFENAEGANTVLEGLTITGSRWGGGIYLYQACPVIRNCIIRDNRGNGILGSFSGDLIIEGCTLARNNGGEWGGGGIHLSGTGSLTVTDCLVTDHSTYDWGYGGGIRYEWWSGEGPPADTPADINITNCVITGNEGDNGAGFYCEAGSCRITDSEITNNGAYDKGGGVYVLDGNCTVENTIISDNTAEGNGGGVCAEYCDITIADSVISQNRSGREGGGLSVERCTGTITSARISNNSAAYFGGGLAGPCGPLLLSNCVLSGNEATDGSIIESVFGTVRNCTIVGNKAGDATIRRLREPVRNCIIWDNRSDLPVAFGWLEYTCVQGGWDGLGSIDLDPCFAVPGYWDPNGTPNDANDDFWVDGDYHLKSEAGRWQPSIYGELDVQADYFIDLLDLAKFARFWQLQGVSLPADLDRSGTVDFNDLTLLLENYLAGYARGAWVYDDVTSPCIDTGNAGCPLRDEPNDANNVRINMGAYGGTAEASKTPLDWGILADLDNDIIVDVNDLGIFCDYWLGSGECVPADLDRSGLVDFLDYALLGDQWLLWQ